MISNSFFDSSESIVFRAEEADKSCGRMTGTKTGITERKQFPHHHTTPNKTSSHLAKKTHKKTKHCLVTTPEKIKKQKTKKTLSFAPNLVTLVVENNPFAKDGSPKEEFEEDNARVRWLQVEDYEKTSIDIMQNLRMLLLKDSARASLSPPCSLNSLSSRTCLRGLEHYIRNLGLSKKIIIKQRPLLFSRDDDRECHVTSSGTTNSNEAKDSKHVFKTLVEYHSMQREYGIAFDVEDLRYVSRQLTYRDRCYAVHQGHLDALAAKEDYEGGADGSSTIATTTAAATRLCHVEQNNKRSRERC